MVGLRDTLLNSYVFAVIQSDITVQSDGKKNEGSFEEREHLGVTVSWFGLVYQDQNCY